MLKDNCTLLVMSCDKYESAWKPFFELLDKYWQNHPKNVVLCTETKKYQNEKYNICMCNVAGVSWSERLIAALEMVKTKYVIFSLEDFFIQSTVDDDEVEKCYELMEKNPQIAQCRFKNCDNKEQLAALGENVFDDFYAAGDDVIFRLDTQIALWNKSWLCSFVIPGENPWQFETKGTERIKGTEAVFLWYKSKNKPNQTEKLMFPYQMSLKSGYGISMRKWLWKNKRLFKKNDIDVDMSELGIITSPEIKWNELITTAIYKKSKRIDHTIFRMAYRVVNKIIRIIKNAVKR